MLLKKCILSLLLILISHSVFVRDAHALYDPFSRQNNFYGVHILFPDEITDAAKLVNSNGGQWGYVTVPIQMSDYNLEKWQKFMDESKKHKVIPIVRVMTEPYWQNTHVWRKPNDLDIIDMANFLNSLSWPVENQYVILFNEMNRFDEWGGEAPNPEEYADTVAFSVDVFKSRNQNFYVIMGGLDNAAPNDGQQYLDYYSYLQRMAAHNPEAFKKIDGFSSHSYPNPDFAEPPSSTKKMGTSTYMYEYEFIQSIAGSPKPVFITETGWNGNRLSEDTIAAYYRESFEKIWGADRDKIVAITPFLLRSHGGFDQFSFIKGEQKTKYYDAFANLSKAAGDPILLNSPFVATAIDAPYVADIKGVQIDAIDSLIPFDDKMTDALKIYFKTILGVH